MSDQVRRVLKLHASELAEVLMLNVPHIGSIKQAGVVFVVMAEQVADCSKHG